MKKIALLLSLVMLMGCLAGCADKKNDPADASVAGGWTLAEPEALDLSEQQAQSFETAFAEAEAKPQPIACLASQVVAGVNYCYLVKIAENDSDYTPGSFALCYIYAGLDDTAELTGIEEIDLSAEDFGSYDEGSASPAGGWNLFDIQPLTEDAALFTQAYGSDQSVTPVALLATQVVAGENLLYLAQFKTNESHKYQLITLYQDLQNDVSVTDQQDFSILPR